MCGLVGVLSNRMDDRKMEIFQGLLAVACIRGYIGSGFAGVPSRPGPISILRNNLETSAELAYGHDLWDLLYGKKNKVQFNCLMGHARAPTSGGFNIEDCHPHVARHVVGMHNGTMRNVMGKAIGKKENDSKLLIQAIGDHGIEKTMEKSEGDYSLVIYNKNECRLFFLRNEKRPMHFATVDGDDNTLFWASERDMLQLVVGRACVSKVKHFSLRPHHLLSFRVYFPDKLQFEQVIDITPKPQENTTNDTSAVFKTVPGVYVNSKEAEALLSKGCANCNESKPWSDFIHHKLFFTKRDEFICSECITHDMWARTYAESFGVPIPASMPFIGQLEKPRPSIN